MKRRLAFILACAGCAQIPLEWLQPLSAGDAETATDEEISGDLLGCLYNTLISMTLEKNSAWLLLRVWRMFYCL
jgi:hypothetical protein